MENEKIIKKLKESGKTLLYFHNNACGLCKQIQPKINLLEGKNKDNFFSINTYENEKLTDLLKVEYVPTLIIVENKKYKKLQGSIQINEFYETVTNKSPDNKGNL